MSRNQIDGDRVDQVWRHLMRAQQEVEEARRERARGYTALSALPLGRARGALRDALRASGR